MNKGNENRKLLLMDGTGIKELKTYLVVTVLALGLAASASAEIATGNYTGDGTPSRFIDNVGFQPDVIIIKGDTGQAAVCRTATMPLGLAKSLSDDAPLAAAQVLSFGAGGFTVGDDPGVNAAGVAYEWVAFRAPPGELVLGSYLGDGQDDRQISGLGFEPVYMFVLPEIALRPWQRFRDITADLSLSFAGASPRANLIQDFLPDGFVVGDAPEVNQAGERYHYVVWAGVTERTSTGEYIGNGSGRTIGGASFEPEYVLVKQAGVMEGTHRTASLDADPSSMLFGADSHITDAIVALRSNGFQIGAKPQVSAAGETYYWVAFSDLAVGYADLEVTMLADRPNAAAGDTVTFTIRVTNLGPDDADGVAVCDPLPPGLEFVGAAADIGSYDLATSTWSVGLLGMSESATLVLQYVVSAGGGGVPIVNTATVCGNSLYDPEPANDSASAVVNAVSVVDLQLFMATADSLVSVGDTVIFNLTLWNPADWAATGVMVTDLLPADFTFLGATPQLGSYDFVSGVWDVGVLESGAVMTLRIDSQVNFGVPGTVLTNTAAITSVDQFDPVADNDTAAVQIRIASVDLAVFKTVDNDRPHQDETVVYTVITENLGPDAATGVAVADVLPAGLLLEAVNPGGGSYDAASGAWSVGDLAAGATDTLRLTISFIAGPGSLDILNTASVLHLDQADPDPTNDVAVVSLTVVELSPMSAVVVQFGQETRLLHPGTPSDEILVLALENGGERLEVLTELSLTNIVPPDSNQTLWDEDWEAIELVIGSGIDPDSADPKVATLVPQVFVDGRLTFSDLDISIAPGELVFLGVRGTASLGARDGDVLRVALNDSKDLVFLNEVDLTGTWPLFSEGSMVVDGMTAAQIALHPVGPSVFQVGSVRNPALAFTVPANGYEGDVLTKLNVVNYEDAAPGDVITGMEAWIDDGDTIFDAASDQLMCQLYSTGGRWERTDLAEPVDLAGLIIIVTVDINDLAHTGSVRLGLPGPDDFGIGMQSGNDGPVDRDLVNPFTQTISASDRMIITTGLIDGGDVEPGGDVVLLHLIANNIYAVSQTLQRMTAHNISVGTAGATGAAMDGLVDQLLLRGDGNGDGVLDDPVTDPVLGTAVFAGGSAVFDGLGWQIPAGETRHFFLTADVSLTGAADGDTLAAVVASAADLDFTQPVSQVASWPLDSHARWRVDGMVAAQVQNTPVPGATLVPGEGPVLALDVVIPSNGALPDALQNIELVNQETATATDFDAVELWADAGTPDFDPAEDTLLGTMTPIAGRWRIQGLDLVIPPGGLRLFASLRVSLTPDNGATVRLALPRDGVEVTSANDGPRDVAVASPVVLLLSTAPLISDLEWDRSESVEEQFVDLRMIVRNNGDEAINDITPSALVFGGNGVFYPPGPHGPASVNLAPSQVDTFTWTLQADMLGEVLVEGNCSGTGSVSNNIRSSVMGQSSIHHVYLPANEMGLYPIGTMPSSINRGQQGVVPLTLTLFNPAGVDAADVELRRLIISLDDGDGNPIVPADLLDQVMVSEGLDVYLTKTGLETSGSTIMLDLDENVTITGNEPVTLALRLNILSNTIEERFRVSIVDSTWLEAYDAISGQRVPVVLQNGSFPVQSSTGILVGEAIGLDVTRVSAAPLMAGQGQTDVTLLSLELVSEGIDPQSSDVEIGAFGVSLVDTNGLALSEPQRFLELIRVLGPLQVHAEHAITSAVDSVVTFLLSPPVTVPVGSQPVTLTLVGNVPTDANLGVLRLQLRSTSEFDARDGNSGTPVQVDYNPDPIAGAPVTIQGLATELRFAGQGALPSIVPVGTRNVTAFTASVRHPGSAGTAAIIATGLHVNLRDGARQSLGVADYIDRLIVWQGDVLLGEGIPTSLDMGEMNVPLSGFSLAAGQSLDLTITVDFEADAPVGLLELLVTSDVLDAMDANQGTPVAVVGETAGDLPLSSGLTLLQTAPDLITVGFTDRMPAVLMADDDEFTVAIWRLRNPSDPSYADAGITTITLHARDDEGRSLAMGDAVAEILAYDGPDTWAVGTLAAGDSTAVLTGAQPLLLVPGQLVTLELRLRLRPGTMAANLQVGLDADDFTVMVGGGGVLSLQVLPEAGSVFPFWTETGHFTGLGLAESYSNFPNPFAAGHEQTNFVFSLPRDGQVSLRMLTPRGETVVQVLDNEPYPAGLHQNVVWDGRNGRGATVRNGVYIAEIRVRFSDGAEERHLRKVAVVR
jgi:uncharacterized repeat protein (TIGR01451 family)